jgi:alpha 1,3-glucosidase
MFSDPFVLVIGLDANGKADGELYVDDGDTFAFAQGALVHRRFGFDGKILTSAPASPGSLPGYDVVVEQVRIAGLSARPSSVSGNDGQPFEIEWTSQILTLHRTNLSLADDFTLKFAF